MGREKQRVQCTGDPNETEYPHFLDNDRINAMGIQRHIFKKIGSELVIQGKEQIDVGFDKAKGMAWRVNN